VKVEMIIDDGKYSKLREWTREYIDSKCIYRGEPIPGKIPGTVYTWQFYLRRGLFDYSFLSAISQMFIYKVEREIGNFDFQIAGLESASTPMLAGIPLVCAAFGLDINAFSVRKERKEYGLMNWIEGTPNDKPVMLMDDLCNSQVSMKRAFDIVQSHDIKVYDYAFCVVNKVNKDETSEEKEKTDKHLPKNIKMMYLFDLDDFNLRNSSFGKYRLLQDNPADEFFESE
jgi:orotate phosphoribosyltransferase